MEFINYDDAIARTNKECSSLSKTVEQYLSFESNRTDLKKEYDIFLSHCYKDAKLIAGLKLILEEAIILIKRKLTVYVDWIEDPNDRSNTTPRIAERLRRRMQKCKCLFFIASEHSPNSKWMPWELGYFDGLRGRKIAVLPLTKDKEKYPPDFLTQEYLGLYFIASVSTKIDKSLTQILLTDPSLIESIDLREWIQS